MELEHTQWFDFKIIFLLFLDVEAHTIYIIDLNHRFVVFRTSKGNIYSFVFTGNFIKDASVQILAMGLWNADRVEVHIPLQCRNNPEIE